MDVTTGPRALGRVAVGVDGSPSARTAVLWAAAEAALRGSSLCLVHATDTDGLNPALFRSEIDHGRRTGRELLDRTAEAVAARHPGLLVVQELSGAPPPAGLLGAAALSGTIVVGHRGLGGFSSLLLGSVGLEVAAAATIPVIVVRGTTEPSDDRVVLAAVRDENDLGCALAAAREAELRKAPLRLLHVWGTGPGAGSRTERRKGDEQTAHAHVHPMTVLADRVQEDFPELTVHCDGEKSRSVPGTLVEATHGAALLVVGGRRSPGYLGPTLGRTTLTLLQHAHCPVELIPRRGPGHGSTS